MTRLLALVFLGLSLAGCRAAPESVVYLVRHAEKAAEPADDPGLTPEGEARALALRDLLRDEPLAYALTSGLQRTVLTALPAAANHGITPMVIPVADGLDAHIQATVRAVRERPGETGLVAGHSNTVTLIIAALGGPALDALDESEYDRLFLLRIDADGTARLDERTYGAPSVSRPPEG